MLLFLPCTSETAAPLEGVLGSAGKEVKSTAECMHTGVPAMLRTQNSRDFRGG